ncbi:unnamed protein product [Rhodiola kirilowii]
MEDDDQHHQPPPPQHNYWCHECDLSVSLFPSLYPVCPHCRSDFLEHMEEFDSSQQPPPIQNPNPNFPSLISAPFSDEHDLNLIDSPDLRRLIRHLTDPDAQNPSFLSSGSAPASKAFVEAMPNVNVFDMLSGEVDEGQILCAICKDQFLADVEAKQLPCLHMYHPDCILPWLEQHNSCPVCRFKLPVEEDLGNGSQQQQLTEGVGVRFWELMESEDMYGFGSTLRHIARRHRNMYPGDTQGSMDSFISPTQLAEAEAAMVGPANSVETVSSSWHIERGVDSSRSGGGGGDVGLGVDEECDGVASGIRVSGSLSAN